MAARSTSHTQAPAAPDLESILSTFDLAYQTSWPAEPGQFWADRYPPNAAPYANLVHARNRRVVALARPGEVLLDIGSGYGDLLYLLRDKFTTLRGVDPSKTSCAMATYNLAKREVSNDYRFMPALAEKLPLENASVDTAIMLDTFEHIEPDNRLQALRECRRVLAATPSKQPGQLILVTPCRHRLRLWNIVDNLLTLRGQLKVRKKHGTPVRIFALPKKDYCEVFTTRQRLIADLECAGFRVEHFERVSFYPAPERGGFFYRFFERWKPGDPRIAKAMARINFFERLGFLNQKMLVVATPETTT